MKYILAHDMGTSGDKATLFTTDGVLYKSVVASYSCSYGKENQVEQNPEEWYAAVCSASRELLKDEDPSDILGIGFSGQMMGAVLLGKKGELLRPAIIWADQRAVRETEWIRQQIGEERFYQITGNRNNPTNSIAKLLWVKRHEELPIEKMLSCKDYLIYRLTGQMGMDYSDASGTGAFDIRAFQWSEEIISCLGIEKSILPELQASVELAGKVTASAARDCGLLEGTPVYRGCGDGAAATVGAGMEKDGDCYCCLGSSAWVACKDKEALLDKEKRTFNLAGIEKGSVFPIGTMQAAGVSYNWMRDQLCLAEKQTLTDGESIYSCINGEMARIPAGANGVMYLPYLTGERSPWWNDALQGAFLGLRAESTHGDMLRAVMEGISMNLNLIFQVLRQRHDFTEIRVMGGCAKEPLWRQMLADMFGVPVWKTNYLEEACSMGAAVAAGIGAGIYQDVTAIRQFLKTDGICEPDWEKHAIYQKQTEQFREVSECLSQFYRNSAEKESLS